MGENFLAIYLKSVEEYKLKNLTESKLKSGPDMTTTRVAKLLKYSSARTLNKKLEEMGILTIELEHRCLVREYRLKGYTTYKINEIALFDGYGYRNFKRSETLIWTPKGIKFLKSQLLNDKEKVKE